jgi:hypothetical protein
MKAGTLGFEDSCDPTLAARFRNAARMGRSCDHSVRAMIHEVDVPDPGRYETLPPTLRVRTLENWRLPTFPDKYCSGISLAPYCGPNILWDKPDEMAQNQ